MKRVKFVGLDVHAETIAVAIAEQDGEIRSLGVIANREESVRKLVRKLGTVEELRFCYEAGPTGYVLYWQLTRMGAKCEVLAPTLVPVKPGDRVKTDRRDALKLARNYRAGELTAVWVPDASSGRTQIIHGPRTRHLGSPRPGAQRFQLGHDRGYHSKSTPGCPSLRLQMCTIVPIAHFSYSLCALWLCGIPFRRLPPTPLDAILSFHPQH